MDGWEGGVLAQLARLSAEYQGSGMCKDLEGGRSCSRP